MNTVRSKSNLRALTETAILVAIGFALSYFKFTMPQGGSITPASMLFILAIGIRRGPAWGVCGALVYSGLQMLQGFYPPPTETLPYFIAVVLLDYVIAFSVLGFAGFFGKKKNGILYAVPVCLFIRFLCHFISGVLIWSVYAGDTPAWIYSLTYNGSYMGAELLICMAAAVFVLRYNTAMSRDKQIFIRQ